MSESPKMKIGVDTRFNPEVPHLEIPESHQKAFDEQTEVDQAIFPKNGKEVFLSKGAISCYFCVGFLADEIVFEHVIFATATKANKFAQEYFERVLSEKKTGEKAKVVMFGTLTRREGSLRSDDRDYVSGSHKNAIFKVNDEFNSAVEKHFLSEEERKDVSLNVVHVPLQKDWDSIAMTIGDSSVVIWDEKSHQAVSMFSYDELESL